MTFLETLLLYFEEEIEGEAYFAFMARRMSTPEHKQKMQLLAEVESYTAKAMRPLVDKYGLLPRSTEELHANGRNQAKAAPADWSVLIKEMHRTYPQYIAGFENLEAMAPIVDRGILKIATAHEVAAVAFVNAELLHDPRSTDPLARFLQTGTA